MPEAGGVGEGCGATASAPKNGMEKGRKMPQKFGMEKRVVFGRPSKAAYP